jgi:hypothetical protein
VKKLKLDETGDSDELQALFDSIAAVGSAPPKVRPKSWRRRRTDSGDSADLEALFESRIADQVTSHADDAQWTRGPDRRAQLRQRVQQASAIWPASCTTRCANSATTTRWKTARTRCPMRAAVELHRADDRAGGQPRAQRHRYRDTDPGRCWRSGPACSAPLGRAVRNGRCRSTSSRRWRRNPRLPGRCAEALHVIPPLAVARNHDGAGFPGPDRTGDQESRRTVAKA